MKCIKFIFLFLTLITSLSLGINFINIKNKSINYQSNDSDSNTSNNTLESLDVDNQPSSSKKPNSDLSTTDTLSNDISLNTLNSSEISTEYFSSIGDYSILVSHPRYSVVVTLKEGTSEIILTSIDSCESKEIESIVNNYIYLNEEDISFILEDIPGFKDEFINYNIFDKYNFAIELLDSSDTNLNSSDLINLAFKYLV